MGLLKIKGCQRPKASKPDKVEIGKSSDPETISEPKIFGYPDLLHKPYFLQ